MRKVIVGRIEVGISSAFREPFLLFYSKFAAGINFAYFNATADLRLHVPISKPNGYVARRISSSQAFRLAGTRTQPRRHTTIATFR